MKTFAILLLCVSFLAAAAGAQAIGPTTLADITPHLHVKDSIVPIKRQDAGLPPVCWNTCLMGAVSEVVSFESLFPQRRSGTDAGDNAGNREFQRYSTAFPEMD